MPDPTTGRATRIDALGLRILEPPDAPLGGGGLVSTASDYPRFAAMLLNGGELDGTRVLSPKTVQFMTSDHLGKEIKNNVAGTEAGRAGYGFGLGVAVRTEPGIAATNGNVGDYSWNGANGTLFWVDPKEEMITVLMTQGAPGPARGYTGALFRQMVRQAIIE